MNIGSRTENLFLTDYCQDYNQCNEFIPLFDFIKVLCSFFKYDEKYHKYVKSILYSKDELSEFYDSQYCFFEKDFYTGFPTPLEIIYSAAGFVKLENEINYSELYIVDSILFNKDGRLKSEKDIKKNREIILENSRYPVYIKLDKDILNIPYNKNRSIQKKYYREIVDKILYKISRDKKLKEELKNTDKNRFFIPLNGPIDIGKIYTAISLLLKRINCKNDKMIKIKIKE